MCQHFHFTDRMMTLFWHYYSMKANQNTFATELVRFVYLSSSDVQECRHVDLSVCSKT